MGLFSLGCLRKFTVVDLGIISNSKQFHLLPSRWLVFHQMTGFRSNDWSIILVVFPSNDLISSCPSLYWLEIKSFDGKMMENQLFTGKQSQFIWRKNVKKMENQLFTEKPFIDLKADGSTYYPLFNFKWLLSLKNFFLF